MRTSSIVAVFLSLVLAVAAVFGVRGFLRDQVAAMTAANDSQAPQNTVVVANQPLRFGRVIEPSSLKVIGWSSATIPEGAFRTIKELVGEEGEERYVIGAIAQDEPILSTKITGPGQRASLSTLLTDGMKAVSIRVDDVLGVAGFVLPGDRVDILLTRRPRNEEAFTDILLQGVRVLAIDQLADDQANKPNVVRTVTLEVSTEEAQKLTLAANVGTLSLALRNVASAQVEAVNAVKIADLGGGVTSQALLEQKLQEERERLQQQIDAEREKRLAELEKLVRSVGENVDKRVEALKSEIDKQPEKVVVEVPTPAPQPEPPKVVTIPPRVFTDVGVFRNTKRTEYKVKILD
ncbi:MAG: Flp pilus assembly protein CpaB [Rhizobiaceae bacterium]